MTIIKSLLLVSLPLQLPRTSPRRITSSFGAIKVRLDGRRRNMMGGVEGSASLRMSVRNSFLASDSARSLSDSWNYDDDDDQDFVDAVSSWNCIGSSHGWLGYIDPHNLSFYLFKPSLINDPSYLPYITLPPIQFLSSDPNVVSKMVFSSSPSPIPRRTLGNKNNSSVLVVITLDRVDQRGPAAAFSRIRDPNWTTLANFPNDSPSDNFQDITYSSKHKLFYVIINSGKIFSWDLSDYHYYHQKNFSKFRYLTKPPPMRIEFEQKYGEEPVECKYYLVMDESSGCLMLIRLNISRNLLDYPHHRKKFIGGRQKIYEYYVDRLDLDRLKWFPVKTLVDNALFVGRNNGIIVDVRQVPGLVKPGYIYLACNVDNHFQLTALQVTDALVQPNLVILGAQITTEDHIMTSFPVWNFDS